MRPPSVSVHVRSPPSFFLRPLSSFHTPHLLAIHMLHSRLPPGFAINDNDSHQQTKKTTEFCFASVAVNRQKRRMTTSFLAFCVSGSHKGRKGKVEGKSKAKNEGTELGPCSHFVLIRVTPESTK